MNNEHLKNDRFEPRSPLFHDERKTPPLTPAPPSTPRSKTKANVQTPAAMTVSVTHVTQGASVVTTRTTTATTTATTQQPPSATSRSSKTTTMMALAMGRSQSPGNSSGSDTDGFASSSASATALRRMYFKSGRSAKTKLNSTMPCTGSSPNATASNGTTVVVHHNSVAASNATVSGGYSAAALSSSSVPKVVIMGSSTASMTDTNINTSTDSASTLVTSVAATDTSETCDSLDMGDTSGQSEPIFSSIEEPLLTAIHGGGDSELDSNEMELTSTMYFGPRMNAQESIESQESSLSIQVEPTSTTPLLSHKTPRTAPLSSNSSNHFPFDKPISPKSARTTEKNKSLFTFKEAEIFLEKQRRKSAYETVQNTDDGCRRENSSRSYNLRRRESSANEKEKRRSIRESSPGKNKSHKESSNNRNNRCYDEDDITYDYDHSNEDDVKKQKREPKFRTKSASRHASNMKTSPKRDRRQINSAPAVTSKEKFFSKQQQLSPSSGTHHQQQQQQHTNRKYSSSSSSSSDRKDITMFPFDREALDYERIQRECFAVDEDPHDSSSTTSSTDSEDHNASVYERKPMYVSPSKVILNACSIKSNDIFQQYTLLSQQETFHSYERKGSKRNRPDAVHHPKYHDHLSTSDAFYPKPPTANGSGDSATTTASSITSPKSHAELHRFDQIASKFDQIPPKAAAANDHQYQGSNANIYGSTNNTTNSTSNLNNNNNRCSSPSNLANNVSSPNGSMRGTPPLPDLRVDFFSEASKLNAKSSSHHQLPEKDHAQFLQQQHHHHHQQQQQHDILDECQRLSLNASVAAATAGNGGPINVTANPMEAAVCTQPRATIVVQQPSLSLDSTVETLLIKSEGDFVSVEQGKDSRKRNSQQLHIQQQLNHHHQQQSSQQQQQQQQQSQTTQQQQQQRRDENMRQLLDVTNTLTFEELRDFEMRYGSPHHSRSQSVKTPGSRASGRPNQLCLPQQRSRVASMPNTGVEEEYYRLRHFSITGKGVVNRGDSLKSRRSRSNNSVASSNSSTEHLTATQIPAPSSARTSATCSLASSRESSTSNPGSGPYRVLMLGGSAVGKSSLVSQFMTSEYLHAYDTSIDDDSGEKSVSVLLSGEESELIFIDHPYTDMTPDDCLTSYDPHGYCVIYSSADRSSFTIAERVLQVLWTNENIAQKAVILVGNKADLARSRHITSEEGKAMATAYDCKFIETSVGINHNVDELLVGLLSQIRLKLENPEKSRDLFRKRSTRKSKRRACSPLGGACLTGNGGTNPNTPVGPANNVITDVSTPPGSSHSSPRKYRGSRTSASLKVKGLLGRVWARDSKSKSCENLHVL
ncbi:bromodomain-containing protein DDB_G0270170 isoform X2 [Episyrphus balteatus]|uniref:bromodomain-containing protein DDB_G0270170 isoform X2 n=1 Tax=Episyrphus balteatus TaxID=286459 RepID=UPI00248549B8|nr:bromodomain-containing protein DDB_G0270170 isoform X2 [Episyrphus balteatus]